MLPNLRRALLVLISSVALAVTTLAATPTPANAVVLPTAVTVSSSVPGALAGTPVTLTADVGFPLLGGLLVSPTGRVTFTASNGGPAVTLGTSTLGAAGCILNLPILPPCRVTLTTTALPVGDVTVTARYAGDLLARPGVGTTQVTVLAAAGAPFAPVLVGTDEVGSIRLDWATGFDGGSSVTSYTLYRSTSPTAGFTKVAEDLPTGDYQETTTPVGVSYYYKATASNAIGESPLSNMTSNQALAFSGPGSHTLTECPPDEQCYSPEVSASADGSTTEISANTEESTSSHVLTTAIGGPNLVNCPARYIGFSGTFNDTSVDAFKTVNVHITGPDALDMIDNSGWPAARVGCLGLGTPWKDGPNPGDFADWSPADGLYVSTPAYCSEMGAFETPVSSGQYSEPCVVAQGYFNPDPEPDEPTFDIEFHLPPGDGRVSGSR